MRSSEIVEVNEKVVALAEKKNLRKRVRGEAPVEDESPRRSSGRNQGNIAVTTVTEVVDAGRSRKRRKGDGGVALVENKTVEEIEMPAIPSKRTRGNSTSMVLDTVAVPEPTRRSTRGSSASLEEGTALPVGRKSVKGEAAAAVSVSDSEVLAEPRGGRTTRNNAVQVVAEPTRRSTRSSSVSSEDDTSSTVVGESRKQEEAGRKIKAEKQAQTRGRKGAEATALLPDNDVAVEPRRRMTRSSSTSLEAEASPVIVKSVKEERVRKGKPEKPGKGRTTLIPVTEAVIEESTKRSTRSSAKSPIDEDATTVEEMSWKSPKYGDFKHKELAASLPKNQAMTESIRTTTRIGLKLLEDEASVSAVGRISSHPIGTDVKIKSGRHVTSSALKQEASTASAPDSEALTSPTKRTTRSSSKLDDASSAQTVGELGSHSDTVRKEKSATQAKNIASKNRDSTAISVKTKGSATKQTIKSSSSVSEERDLVVPLLSDIEATITPSRRSTRSSAQQEGVSFPPVVSFGVDAMPARKNKSGKRAASQAFEGAETTPSRRSTRSSAHDNASSRGSTRSSAHDNASSPPVVSFAADIISARKNISVKRAASQASEGADSMALVSDNEAAITIARRSARSSLKSSEDSHALKLGDLPAVLSGDNSETTPGRRFTHSSLNLSEDVPSTPVVGKSNAVDDSARKGMSKEARSHAFEVADSTASSLDDKAVMTPATRSTRSSLKSLVEKSSMLVDDGTARKDKSGKVADSTASSLDDKAVTTPATRSTRSSLKSLEDKASKLLDDGGTARKNKSGKQSKFRASKHDPSTASASRLAVTEPSRSTRSSSMQNLFGDDTLAVGHDEVSDHDVEVQEHVSEKQGQLGSKEEVHREPMLEMEVSATTEGVTNVSEVQHLNVSPSPPTVATSISSQIDHEEPSAEGETHRADALASSEAVKFVFSPLIQRNSEELAPIQATEISPQLVTENPDLKVEGDGPNEDVSVGNEAILTSDPVVSGTVVLSETSDIRVEVADSQVEAQYVSKAVEYTEAANSDSKVEVDDGQFEDVMAGDEPVKTSDPMTTDAAVFPESTSDINAGESESKVEVQDVNEVSLREETDNNGSTLPEVVPEDSCYINFEKPDLEMEAQDASEGRKNSEATSGGGLPSPSKYSRELSPAVTSLEDSNLQAGIHDSTDIPIDEIDHNDKDAEVPIVSGGGAVKTEGCEEESDAVSIALLVSVECNALKETEETPADNTTPLGPGETEGACKSVTLPSTVTDDIETEVDKNEDGTNSVSDMQTCDKVNEDELQVTEGGFEDAIDVHGSEEDDAVDSGGHEREAEGPFSPGERPAVALKEDGTQLSPEMTLDNATPASHNANQSDSTQMSEGGDQSPGDAEVNMSGFSGNKSLVIKDLSNSPGSSNSPSMAYKENECPLSEPVGLSCELTEGKSSVDFDFDSDTQSPDSSKPVELMENGDRPEAVDVESSSLAVDGGNTGASHLESDKDAVEEGETLHTSVGHAEEILPEGGTESPATLGFEDSTKQADTENTRLPEQHRDAVITVDGETVQKSPQSALETCEAMEKSIAVADDVPETFNTAVEPIYSEHERDLEQIEVVGEDMENVDLLEGETGTEVEHHDTSMERAVSAPGHDIPAAELPSSTYMENAHSVIEKDENATGSEEEETRGGEESQPANLLSLAEMLEESSATAAAARETSPVVQGLESAESPGDDLANLSHKSGVKLDDDNKVGDEVEPEVPCIVPGDLKNQEDSPAQSEKADDEGKTETSLPKTESLSEATIVSEKHALDSVLSARSIDSCTEVEEDETSTSGAMDIFDKCEESCSIPVVASTETVNAEDGVDHSTCISVEKTQKIVFIGGSESNEASFVTVQPPLGRQELIGSSIKESLKTLVTDRAEDRIGVSICEFDRENCVGSSERVAIDRAEEDMGVPFCQFDQENHEDDDATGCRDSETERNSRNPEEAADVQDTDGIDIAEGSGTSSEGHTHHREPDHYQDNPSFKQASNVEGSWIPSGSLSVDELFHMDNDMADFMDDDAQAGQWGCNLREDFGPDGCGNYGEVHGAETLPSAGNHMEPMATSFNAEREQACLSFSSFDNYLGITYPGSDPSPRGKSLYRDTDHINKHEEELSRAQFEAQEQSRIITQEAPGVSSSFQHGMVGAMDGTKVEGSAAKRVELQADSAREHGFDQDCSWGFGYRQGSAIKGRSFRNELIEPESDKSLIGSQNAIDTQKGKTSDETLADKTYFDVYWSDPENVDVPGSHHEVQDMDYPFDLTLAQKDMADDSLKSDADANKDQNMSSELGTPLGKSFRPSVIDDGLKNKENSVALKIGSKHNEKLKSRTSAARRPLQSACRIDDES